MLYLTDSYPSYCPRCVRIPLPTTDRRREFDSGQIQRCQCGMQFVHLPNDIAAKLIQEKQQH